MPGRRAGRCRRGRPRWRWGSPARCPPRWSPATTSPRTWWGRPEQRGGLLHPAVGHQAADPGRGDGLGPGRRRPRPSARRDTPSTSNPAVGAHLPQQGHVPLAPVAEVEVLAHHHQPGAEARRPGSRPRTPRPSRWPAPRRRGPPPSGPPRPLRAARASGRGRRGGAGPTRGGPRWPDGGRRSPPRWPARRPGPGPRSSARRARWPRWTPS